MPIELRLLRDALALAEHRNFGRAAHSLNMSQPALSRNIQEIERRVETQLFERGTGTVALTDAGKIFLAQARKVVARSDDLDREMNLLKGFEAAELTIGSGTYQSGMVVDRAVARLLGAHPAIRLRIWNDNYANLLPLLRRRVLDCAVIGLAGVNDDQELHITKLNEHRSFFVVRSGHPLRASKETPTLESILGFPVVATSGSSPSILKRFLAGGLEKHFAHATAKSFPAIACESVAMMKTIVLETDAVGIMPLHAAMAEVRAGQLVFLSLIPEFMKVSWAIVRLVHHSLSRVGETFVRFVLDADAELLDFEEKNTPTILVEPRRAPPGPRPAKRSGKSLGKV